MYADRANRTRMSPAGLTMAVGINAALLAALIWSAPELPKVINWDPIEAINIPIPPPPPPIPKVEPTKTVEAPRPIDPYVPPKRVDVPTKPTDRVDTTDVILPPDTGTPPGTGTGTGGGVTVDPPKPLPVVTVPEIDSRYADDLQPDYPADMRRAGLEGQVVVKVLVGTNGRVKAIELVSSPHDSFFQATRRQALSRWRFKPATRDGIPFESWRTMRLGFHLTDA
ncbi:TonB family protein [Sphingomonas cannabina]|uniref:energy transducer TonB n=1 Tax=Sphingomonas cannabina TaxID=2899123 RepID=UPI001F2D2798|nr:energy transducer TonB [Sphingomonas cannabina]UIJ45647.1 TonB family protein [Sphingomonas cannabina]